MVARAAPAVTSEAFCECPPTARTTAVCDVPPPAGIAPSSAPPRFAAPVATSSRFASIGVSSPRANARPAAIVSVKLISAMPSAPGASCAASARSGRVGFGRPCGMRPTVDTPTACSPSNHDAAMLAPTAISGAGECGFQRSIAISSAKVAVATASVAPDAAGNCCRVAARSAKKPCFAMWMPNSLGNWSSTMTSPMPALNPVSTGAEMKLATNPSRSSRAASRIAPTSTASVAVALARRAGSPSGTARPSWVPVRIASVAVELTLSTRDEPSSA